MKSIALALAALVAVAPAAFASHPAKHSHSSRHVAMADSPATLAQAAYLVDAYVTAPIVRAELHAEPGAAAHYDIDLQLPDSGVARLMVDADSRAIGWHNPPVVAAR
jgi:hypothetical protein